MDGLYNPYVSIPLATWFVTQLFKFSLRAWQGKLDFRLFYSSGGMPSAHSAVVSALVVTTLFLSGPKSPIFGLSLVFAAIVLYDSFGVRRASGDQAVAINAIIENLKPRTGETLPTSQKLREIFGHKPSEVVAGIGLGAVVALLMTLSIWSANLSWLSQPAGLAERYIYLGWLGLLTIGGLVSAFHYCGGKRKRLPTIRQLKKVIIWFGTLPAGLGLLLVLAQPQITTSLAWRLWPVLISVSLAILHGGLFYAWYRHLPARISAELQRRSRGKRRHKRKR